MPLFPLAEANCWERSTRICGLGAIVRPWSRAWPQRLAQEPEERPRREEVEEARGAGRGGRRALECQDAAPGERDPDRPVGMEQDGGEPRELRLVPHAHDDGVAWVPREPLEQARRRDVVPQRRHRFDRAQEPQRPRGDRGGLAGAAERAREDMGRREPHAGEAVGDQPVLAFPVRRERARAIIRVTPRIGVTGIGVADQDQPHAAWRITPAGAPVNGTAEESSPRFGSGPGPARWLRLGGWIRHSGSWSSTTSRRGRGCGSSWRSGATWSTRPPTAGRRSRRRGRSCPAWS